MESFENMMVVDFVGLMSWVGFEGVANSHCWILLDSGSFLYHVLPYLPFLCHPYPSHGLLYFLHDLLCLLPSIVLGLDVVRNHLLLVVLQHVQEN